MGSIDEYAYRSKLRTVCPEQKVIFSLMILITCLVSKSTLMFGIVILIMSYLTINKGGVPLILFIKLMGIPLTFLIISILTILVQFSRSPEGMVKAIFVGGFYIGVVQSATETSKILFLKSMASVTTLYFLCLSTPITDILIVLEKIKCPAMLTEMMGLIYRFIFILIDAAFTMQTALTARLGYKDFKTGIKSMGVLLSTLLVRALKMNDKLYTALEARGYSGSLYVLNDETYQKVSYIKIIAIECVLILAIIIQSKFS